MAAPLYHIFLYATTIISLLLALLLWRRRPAPGATVLAFLMLAVAEWSLGYALELRAVGPDDKLFWAQVEYLGIVVLPVAWLIFVFQYTFRDQWLTTRNRILLAAIPTITVVLVWTNPGHHLIWSRMDLRSVGPLRVLDLDYGPWFWVHTTYSYLLLALGSFLVLQLFIRSPYPFRQQAAGLLVSALLPWLGNAAYLWDLGPLAGLDLTPFALGLSGMVATWSLFRLGFLDVVPVARQAVVEGMADAVFVLDQKDRLLDLNPAARRLIGREVFLAMGHPIDQVLSAWPEEIVAHFQGSATSVEVALTERDYELQLTHLPYRHSRLATRLVTLRDITQRKQVEKELRRAKETAEIQRSELAAANLQLQEMDRLKSRFISTISHELRTPVTNLTLHLYLLRRGPLARQEQYLAVLEQEIAGFQHLIESILDFTLLQQAPSQIGFASVDLNSLVAQVVDRYRARIESKGLDLIFDVDPDLPPVWGEGDRLERLVSNLLDNAFAFTQEGTIRILTCRLEGQACLEVQDTGIGIASDDLPNIFRRFYRGENANELSRSGAGLGLSVVRAVTELHGGKVTVESQVGKGSTFRVCLPPEPDRDEHPE